MKVDDSQVTKHEQLRKIILALIKEQLSPGDRLPSERVLTNSYGISRITVRAAIGQLVNEGYLIRVPAKGTFVADSMVKSTLHLASFTQEVRAMGFVPSTVVLVAETRTVPEGVAAELDIPANSDAIYLRRLRLADGQPLSVDDAWYHPEHARGLLELDLAGSVYEALARHLGREIDRAHQSIQAESATTSVADLLGVGEGTPILAFSRTAYSGGQIMEHCRSKYRSDRYALQMELRSTAPLAG